MNSFHPEKLATNQIVFHQNVIFHNHLIVTMDGLPKVKRTECLFYNVENLTPKICTPFQKVLPKGCLMCPRNK